MIVLFPSDVDSLLLICTSIHSLFWHSPSFILHINEHCLCTVHCPLIIYVNELLRHGPINPTPNNRQTARITVLAELNVDLREEMTLSGNFLSIKLYYITHSAVICTTLVEFAVSGVGESPWAIGFGAWSTVSASIGEVECHRVSAVQNRTDSNQVSEYSR